MAAHAAVEVAVAEAPLSPAVQSMVVAVAVVEAARLRLARVLRYSPPVPWMAAVEVAGGAATTGGALAGAVLAGGLLAGGGGGGGAA